MHVNFFLAALPPLVGIMLNHCRVPFFLFPLKMNCSQSWSLSPPETAMLRKMMKVQKFPLMCDIIVVPAVIFEWYSCLLWQMIHLV